MKKIMAILAGITIALNIYAQQTASVKVNITGSINWSGIAGRDTDSLSTSGKPSMKPGFSVGLMLNNQMSKQFSLRHELQYTFHTTQLKMEEGFNSRFMAQYIELFPVTPAWSIGQLQLYAGPYMGLLLAASIQQKDENGKIYTNHQFFGGQNSEGRTMQKWEAGCTAGVEYTFTEGVALGIRYAKSLTPMMENAAHKDQWKIGRQSFRVSIACKLQNK